MSVQNLTSEAAGFLYTIFNQASTCLQHPTQPLTQAEKATAFDLSIKFDQAAGAARFNEAAELDKIIPDLVTAVQGFATPGLQHIAEDIKLRQQLMYHHASPQLKADLGTYSKGIF
ncbi:MAG: hypothetical protein ACAH83_03080 [Alphaproteobacteria bacterium]